MTAPASEGEPSTRITCGPTTSSQIERTTGDRFGDHVRQVRTARRAFEVAQTVLAPGGHFVCKVFDGEEGPDFVAEVRACFGKVKRLRPEAVRRESVEFFVVALDFQG